MSLSEAQGEALPMTWKAPKPVISNIGESENGDDKALMRERLETRDSIP